MSGRERRGIAAGYNRSDDARQSTLFDSDPDPWQLDAAHEQLTASVVFAGPPHGPYDYSVPPRLPGGLRPGQRVEVPLGKGDRTLIGYCTSVGLKTGGRPLKPIGRLVDPEPLLSPAMLRLAEWMAHYYLCTLGQVLHAMLPAGVRGKAGTREMTFLSVPPAVREQLAAGKLKLGEKQLDALRILAAANRPLTAPELAQAAKCTLSPISELRKKKLVKAEVQRIQQVEIGEAASPREEHLQLNSDQQRGPRLRPGCASPTAARNNSDARRHRQRQDRGLHPSDRGSDSLWPTGDRAGARDQPDAADDRRGSVGGSIASRCCTAISATPSGTGTGSRSRRGEVQVVVGRAARSLPRRANLGLIVIDEEHESYVQAGATPRYHARDVAVKRAELEGVPLVLGSATPSLESWQRATGLSEEFNVQSSTSHVADGHSALSSEPGALNWRLIDMPRRVNDRPLPAVATIDLRDEFKAASAAEP